ncbi:hypothetical protein B0H14DRAFT_3695487 [Mycena olivaceomarginata]|nr:hypothetical protein B0H14DRAFT_3695487 [Mycena olivaceomarginata]
MRTPGKQTAHRDVRGGSKRRGGHHFRFPPTGPALLPSPSPALPPSRVSVSPPIHMNMGQASAAPPPPLALVIRRRRTDVDVDVDAEHGRRKQLGAPQYGRQQLFVPIFCMVPGIHDRVSSSSSPPSSSSSSSSASTHASSSSSSGASPSTETSGGSGARIGHGIVVGVADAAKAEEREKGNNSFTGLRLSSLTLDLGFPPDVGNVRNVRTGAGRDDTLHTMGGIPGGVGSESIEVHVGAVGVGSISVRRHGERHNMHGVGGGGGGIGWLLHADGVVLSNRVV